MNDAGPVALILCAVLVARFGIFTPARVARFLRKRRERLALGRLHLLTRFPAVVRNRRRRRFHHFRADPWESGCENFSCNIRSAFRASNRTLTKSKAASNIAVSVSQPQTNQKRMNQTGC